MDFPYFSQYQQRHRGAPDVRAQVSAGLLMLQMLQHRWQRDPIELEEEEIVAVRETMSRVPGVVLDSAFDRRHLPADLQTLLERDEAPPPVPRSKVTRSLLQLLDVLQLNLAATPALMEYGRALEDEGAHDVACDVYGLALLLGRSEYNLPFVPAAHVRLGYCLGRLNRRTDATHAFRAAIAVAQEGNSGDRVTELLATVGLAILHMTYGDYDAARPRLDWVIETATHEDRTFPRTQALYARAVLARHTGDTLLAQDLWQQARAFYGGDAEIARFLSELGRIPGR